MSYNLISNLGQRFSELFTGLPLNEIYQFQHTNRLAGWLAAGMGCIMLPA